MYLKVPTLILLFLSPLILQAQTIAGYSQQEDYFKTGLELLEKEKFSAARHEFEKYLNAPGEGLRSQEAQYYVAYSALRLYNADGEKMVENFIDENRDHPKALMAYYELGNFYFKDNNYSKAIEYYEKLDVNGLSKKQATESRFKSGYAHFSQRQFDKALEQFNQIKKTNNRYTYAASYYAGFVEYRNQDYSQALIDLQRAETNEAYAAIVPYMIANVYYQQKRWDDLIGYSQEVLERSNLKNQAEIALLTGEAYYQKNDFQTATRYFERYLENKKGAPDTEVLYRIAYTQYVTGQNSKAIDNFKSVAVSSDTISQYASFYLGELYVKEGNKPFAATAFEKAASLDYNEKIKEQSAFNFARVNYDLEKYDEAINALKSYINSYPEGINYSDANDLLSEAYLNTSNYNQAIQHIESLPSKSGRVKQAYQKVTFYKGTEYFNNAKFYNAVQLFEKSLKYPLNQDFVIMANYWSGEAYTTGKKYQEAIKAYTNVLRKAVPSNIYHLKTQYGIGYAYYNTGQYEEALNHFRGYVAELEGRGNQLFYNDALLRLADCYYARKSYKDALVYYQKAIRQDNPDKDYAYFQKALVLGIQGNISAAKADFDIVINQYPRSTYIDDAIFQKTLLDFEQGNYQAAVDGFTNLIENKNQSGFVPNALLRRAIANANLGRNKQTEKDYKRILDEYPTHEVANSALSGLQQTLAADGRLDEFDAYLARYKTANPDSEALASVEYEAAKNLYFNQEYEKAIAKFEEYAKNYPHTNFADEAVYYIGESYYRMNQIDKALEYHYRVIKENKIDRTDRSIQRVAELEYRQGNFQAAITRFNELGRIASTKKEQYNAWSGLMESYFQLQKLDSVDYYAELILQRGNVNANAQNKANLYLGKAAFGRGELDQAKDQFLLVINSAKDINGAEAQYLLAELQYNNSEYHKSIETLYNLNKNFSIYEKWLGQSFLLIADNYIALDEDFQARATLNSLVEKSPIEAVVEQAKEKLLRIEQKEKQEEERLKNEVDTTQYQIMDSKDTSSNGGAGTADETPAQKQ